MTMQLIETVELASAAASIEFTSIPQDGVDLVLVASIRADVLSVYSSAYIQINGTSTDYAGIRLIGTGSAAVSGTEGSTRILFNVPGTDSTSNTFGNSSFLFSNYASSSNKSISHDGVTENNGTDAIQRISALSWANTSAITSLNVYSTVDFVSGSTASLYKITAD